MKASLARVLRIGTAEALHTLARTGTRTWKPLLLLLVLSAALLPLVLERGAGADRDLYRVATTGDSTLDAVVMANPAFRVTASADPEAAVQRGRADIGLERAAVYALDTPKAAAALRALEQAADAYARERLRAEEDQAAAFPVRVSVTYLVRTPTPAAATPATTGETPIPTTETPGPGAAEPPAPPPPEDPPLPPGQLEPPFPVHSLLLAYVYLVPANFVVQLYAGSIMTERLDRRGEPLLATPARRFEILLGKTWPYAALLLLESVIVTAFIGGTWLSVLAVQPLLLAFLALALMTALVARSYRELTFLTVFTSVFLTVYAFLPAAFATVHPIAFISPVSLIVHDLRHDPVTLVQIVYATLPLALFSAVLIYLANGMLREEDLFHQKPVAAKLLDTLAQRIHGIGAGFRLAILLLPLVLVAELLLVAFLQASPLLRGALPALLAVSLVEEAAKAAPAAAAAARNRIPRARIPLVGTLSGAGFFLAEKAFLLASVVGLLSLPAGRAVLGTGAAAAAPIQGWILLILGPLALHILTATLTGIGAQHGRRALLAAFAAAVLVHTAYNYSIVLRLGGAP